MALYLQFPYQPKCVMCFSQSLEPVDYAVAYLFELKLFCIQIWRHNRLPCLKTFSFLQAVAGIIPCGGILKPRLMVQMDTSYWSALLICL